MRPRSAWLAMLCILACRETTNSNTPAPLLLTDIAAGYYATCGLAPDGAAFCWGNGRYGQIGVDSADDCSSVPDEDACAHTPRRVAGGLTFTSIVAGGAHFCALTAAGLVYCWGDDRWGQLGTLDTAATCGFAAPGPCARTPQLAYLPPPATQISAGDSHSCAVVDASYCWGYGGGGRLGLGSNTNQEQPRVIAAGMLFASVIAGGSFTCGIGAADSLVYCWGINHLGQLGDGTTMGHGLPEAVADTTRYVALAAGTAHACGITLQGTARCWGGAETHELADTGTAPDCFESYACRATPVAVSGGLTLLALATGHAFTCGVTATNSYCWGAVPGLDALAAPTVFGAQGLAGGAPFIRVTAGFMHGCGITAAHEAYCWGEEYHGLLGDGPTESSGAVPVRVIAPE